MHDIRLKSYSVYRIIFLRVNSTIFFNFMYEINIFEHKLS